MGVLRYWESAQLLKSVLLLVGEGTCIRRQRDIRKLWRHCFVCNVLRKRTAISVKKCRKA